MNYAIIVAVNSILLLAAALTTNICGTVTFQRDGLAFFFVDDERGTHWRIAAPSGTPIPPVGTQVEVTGQREPSVKPRLADTTVKAVGKADVPPALKLSPKEIYQRLLPFGNNTYYGDIIECEGILRDINRRQKTTQLLVGEGDANIQVEMPWALEDALPAKLVPGAVVRVTGALTYTSIENYEEGVFGRIENIELLPTGPESLAVIKNAPFWTVGRLRNFIIGTLVLLCAVFAWANTLRRMVAKKTRELADSIRQRETAQIEENAARRERLRLAADLHDGFQQYLAGAMFRLKAAQNYLPPEAAESRSQLEKVKDALQHTQNGLRATLWAMNEECEGPESLTGLFRFVARRLPHWEETVEFITEGEERKIPHNYAGTLLLILQEAVGNAITHGKAASVKVTMTFGEEKFVMKIADDGCGFDTSAARSSGHYGISGMERRAADLGGRLEISARPGEGATVFVEIPLPPSR